MALRFYNTLSQQVEEFSPASDNTVRMYTCGPTVYDFAHIGNFRTFTFVDLLRKWLRANGFELNHVMNITDVDDKIIRNAVAQHKSLDEYTADLHRGLPGRLRHAAAGAARAADAAPPSISTTWWQAIEKLADDEPHLHAATGPSTSASPPFPGTASSRTTISAATWPARAWTWTNTRRPMPAISRCGRRPRKASRSGRHRIGPGRPGWHIECSVMAIKYLGETLDIHAGGIDLVFPHHENEIAQSESLTGKPFARFWLHAEFLMVEGQKMSKSLGNYYHAARRARQGPRPGSDALPAASVPYRKQLNFTFDGLKSAAIAIERLRNFKLRLETDTFAGGRQRAARGAHGRSAAQASPTA